MDVAKYIGLFLLKNEQCYVNGLGTLQLLRKAATYDGQSLHPASYEITLAQGGNVDESLSNYIANNEQVSITKASNALKEFSSDTKNQLQAGNSVVLPHLGKFIMQDDGRINFITIPQLQYKAPPIPAQKGISLKHNERPAIPHQPFVLPTAPINNPVMAGGEETMGGPPAMPQVKQYMQKPPEEGGQLNWARIIFVILLLIILAGLAYYGYQRYLAPTRQMQPLQAPLTAPELTEEPADAMLTDSTTLQNDSAKVADTATAAKAIPIGATKPVVTPPAQTTPQATISNKNLRDLKVVLYTSDSRSGAYKLKNSTNAHGSKIDVIEESENYFFVVVRIKTTDNNNDRIEDSVSKVYNVEEAFVY